MNRKIMITCFAAVLLLPHLMSLIQNSSNEADNIEKRELAAFPSFSMENLSEYPASLEAYLNDHAPMRSQLLDLYAGMNLRLFGSIDHADVIKGKEGWLFYTGNGSVDDYIGINLFTEKELELIVDKLLVIRDNYAGSGNFVFMIAPNKEIVYSRYMPDSYPFRHDNGKANQLVEYIRAHSDIPVVYPLELLKEQGKENLLYYKTDTHWNAAGGFLAAQELIKALGGEAHSLSDISLKYSQEIPDIRGDLADIAHLPEGMRQDEAAEISYNEEVTLNSEKLVMVRDSFGDAMIPVLNRYYASPSYIDWQTATPDILSQQKGDVLVYEIVERNLGRLLFDLNQFLE